jgi:hypothetical protein
MHDEREACERDQGMVPVEVGGKVQMGVLGLREDTGAIGLPFEDSMSVRSEERTQS